MFTQLVNGIFGVLGTVPGLMVYAIVAVWIGVDVAGIPLPMEPVLLFVGAMGAVGRTSMYLAVLAAVLGSMAFATVAYHLGQHFGKPAITRAGRRVGFNDERADHIELWLRRRGVAGVLVTTICPVIRTFSAYIMGIAEVPIPICAAGVFVGSLLYSSLWIIIGRALGANYRAPLAYVDRLGLFGFVVLAAAAATGMLLHHFWGESARQYVAAHYHRHKHAASAAPAVNAALVANPAPSIAAAGATGATLAAQPLAPVPGSSTVVATAAPDDAPATLSEALAVRSGAVARPWPRQAWVLLVCFWTIAAILLLLMASTAHTYAEFPPDTSMSLWIQHLRGTPFAATINTAGDLQWFLPTGIALALIFGTLLALRLVVEAIFLALASFGTDLINVVINTLVARPRPHGVHITTLVSSFGSASFPSGHVAHAVGLYGFVFFLCVLGIRARPRWKRELIAVQVVCVYFILFVGPSRVLEGQHWPSDVAAGYLVGALSLSVAIVLYHAFAERTARGLASGMRMKVRPAT